jgi:uncharacterized protein (TIGR00725 family)
MYQLCISGASHGKSAKEGKELAAQLGQAIAKSGHALMTGATVGLTEAGAIAYVDAGGKFSLGISPAASKIEHVLKYRLPTKPYHSILFTGLHYVGRDVLLINSSDAVVFVGGRTGTLHEFTVAIETDKTIGFLQGAGGISDEIMDILHAADRNKTTDILFSEDAEDLVNQVVASLDKKNKKYLSLYE